MFLVTLTFLLVLLLLEVLATKLQYPHLDMGRLAASVEREDYDTALYLLSEDSSVFGELLNLAVNLMGILLGVGFSYYCLNVARGKEEAGFGDLFDPFGYFFRAIALNLVCGFFILLWSLLLVVPGIIAAYRYSMAVYILMDHPDMPVMECLQQSKALTRGHKGELFLLDLSFLGWILLSAIPFVACYTVPYIRTTRANYYRVLSGRMEEPVHVDYTV